MPRRSGSDRITIPQGILVAIFTGAVSWASTAITNFYRENGSTAQAREDEKRIAEQRNRETEDIKTHERLMLEHLLRNCGCPPTGGKR
jgi:hypothetical protein